MTDSPTDQLALIDRAQQAVHARHAASLPALHLAYVALFLGLPVGICLLVGGGSTEKIVGSALLVLTAAVWVGALAADIKRVGKSGLGGVMHRTPRLGTRQHRVNIIGAVVIAAAAAIAAITGAWWLGIPVGLALLVLVRAEDQPWRRAFAAAPAPAAGVAPQRSPLLDSSPLALSLVAGLAVVEAGDQVVLAQLLAVDPTEVDDEVARLERDGILEARVPNKAAAPLVALSTKGRGLFRGHVAALEAPPV